MWNSAKDNPHLWELPKGQPTPYMPAMAAISLGVPEDATVWCHDLDYSKWCPDQAIITLFGGELNTEATGWWYSRFSYKMTFKWEDSQLKVSLGAKDPGFFETSFNVPCRYEAGQLVWSDQPDPRKYPGVTIPMPGLSGKQVLEGLYKVRTVYVVVDGAAWEPPLIGEGGALVEDTRRCTICRIYEGHKPPAGSKAKTCHECVFLKPTSTSDPKLSPRFCSENRRRIPPRDIVLARAMSELSPEELRKYTWEADLALPTPHPGFRVVIVTTKEAEVAAISATNGEFEIITV